MLATCPSDKCRIQIAYSGVGPVTPAEVDLAAAIGGAGMSFFINTSIYTYLSYI